ncbi:hypothetical protein WS62_19490 [Burkholderia sp. ABCPW 14]|nr:hypothetical protein WS62_19490 [Burkholderia sp. ABCPW 14]
MWFGAASRSRGRLCLEDCARLERTAHSAASAARCVRAIGMLFARKSDACAGRDPYRFVTACSPRNAAQSASATRFDAEVRRTRRSARQNRRPRRCEASGRDRLLHDAARATHGLY